MTELQSDIAYLVGIGASAGGLEALQDFFQHIPPDTHLAFVVIQHLSSDYKSVMDELLQKHTSLPITVVEKDCDIEPDHIYLISSHSNLVIQDHRLVVKKKDPQQRLNLPIDLFFHSLGEAFQERSMGVILSGTGTDGSRGVKTIKENDGLVMAQSPHEARFDGMPNAVVHLGLADFVLGTAELAEEITRLAYHAPWLRKERDLSLGDIDPQTLKRILAEIKKHCHIDFSMYRRQTIHRRLLKRMRLLTLSGIEDYYYHLISHKDECHKLMREFLIGVTRFFRDPETWEMVMERALPELCAQADPEQPLRMWVAGCSTGEEAYSLAMLVDEYLQQQQLALDFKIFATDADEEVIQFASQGRYPDAIFTTLNTERLARYFDKEGETYVVKKYLRDHLVFARHNLLVDPPFLKQDLICCRNLLIYFQPEAQRKALTTLQFSLRLGGVLFLGKSESLGSLGSMFRPIAAHINLFHNIEATRTNQVILDNYLAPHERRQSKPSPETHHPARRSASHESNFFENALIEQYVPAVLFVTRHGEVLYTHGSTHPFILFPRGRVNYDLKSMLKEPEYSLIQNGMQRAQSERQPIAYQAVPLERGEQSLEAHILIRALWYAELEQYVFLIEFTPTGALSQAGAVEVQRNDFAAEQLSGLRHELQQKNRELNALREKLETSNEELQASNEELLASNEELQSTNEELQSVNEELYTLNSELEAKILSLNELNNDLSNFLNSTQIGLLFLDKNLQLRRFTPSLSEVFNFYDTDIGRPLARFTLHFDQGIELDTLARQVLSDGQGIEREVSIDGQEYLLRLLPYTTLEKAVEGVVMSLVNITERNRMQRRAQTLDLRYRTIFAKMPDYLAIVDREGCFRLLNQTLNPKIAGLLIGKPLCELFGGEQTVYLEAIEKTLKGDQAAELTTHTNRDGLTLWYAHRLCLLPGDGFELDDEVIVVSRDITELRSAEQQLQREALKLQRLIDSSDDMIAAVDPDYCLIVSNRAFKDFVARWFGVEHLKSHFGLRHLPQHNPGQKRLHQQLIEVCRRALEGETFTGAVEFSLPDGKRPNYQLHVTQMRDTLDQSLRAVLALRDVTSEHQAQRRLEQTLQELERTNAYLDSFVYAAAHDLRSPVANLMSLIERLQHKPQIAAEPMFELLDKSVHSLDQTLGGLIEIIDVQKLSGQPARSIEIPALIDQILLHYPSLNSGQEGLIELKLEVKSIFYIEAYFHSIIQNLIDNAYKYRKNDDKLRITISSRRCEDDIIVEVSDNGLGLPPQLTKDKLFRAFHRYHQEIEGKGIGLYLVKTLVEKNGGWVEVESMPTSGTRFILGLREYEQPSSQ